MTYTVPYAGGWKDLPLETTPITASTLNAISNELASYNAAWTSFTPGFTNVTLGDGTSEGLYQLIGRVAIVRFKLTLGSTSAIAGGITTVVPAVRSNIRTTYAQSYLPYGNGVFFDTSAGVPYGLVINLNGSNTMRISAQSLSGSYIRYDSVSATVPVAYGAGDVIAGQYMYETAA